MKDFYYIMGTRRDCTPAELNSAYRKLARNLQPAGQETDDFLDGHLQEVTEAYLTLSDPAKRRKYDAAYRKSYLHRGYYFRLSYLNVAATLSLLMFTALFGMYVNKVLSGSKAKNIAKTTTAAPILPATRHKKKRHIIANPLVKTAAKPIHRDTVKKQLAPVLNPAPAKPMMAAISKPAPVVAKKIVTEKTLVEKPMPVKPAPEKPLFNDDPPPATYSAYLKANVTGVVSLHQQGNYRSAVLANIPGNTKVLVLEKGPGFYKVQFNGQTGYVPKWTVSEE